ncbi:thioredoxin family protein [Maricaulaceae bacterium NA33B04]|nr:thioredoxin family protein [Maricaulaceae bacterium NA33B04]
MTAPIIPDDTPFDEIAEPYDLELDVQRALNDAFARARTSGKRVLVKLGGAWCPDCRVLAGMMAIPAVHAFLAEHFEIVTASIGRYDVNQDVVARLGFADGLPGAPTVLVMTADGAVANRASADHWRTARQQKPQHVIDYFDALTDVEANPSDRVAVTHED